MLLAGDFSIENSLGNFYFIPWYFTSFEGRPILRKDEIAIVATYDLFYLAISDDILLSKIG